MSFVVFDTEYTSWEGCQERGWTGNRKKEIVQISALKLSDELEVIAEFNALCKPKINPVLSDYFVNLTHISNEDVLSLGESFSSVYEKFVRFAGEDVCFSHGWGGDFFNKSDGDVIEQNLELYNITSSQKLIYRNIAPIFKRLYEENGIDVQSQSSGQIAGILGLLPQMEKLGLNPHNALYDVYSIVQGLRHFYPHSVELLKNFAEAI